MQQIDFERFKSIMAGMGRVFSADIDGVILDAYWLALGDWSLTEFERAASHLLANATFMPKPVEFNNLRRRAVETSAGDAWALVLEKVRTMLPRESASVDAKTDAVVRQMGGYQHLCTMTSDELPWRMKRFTELWADMGEVEEARIALPSAGGKRIGGPAKVVPQVTRQ